MVKVRTGAWQSSYPVYDGHGNMVCSLSISRPALATNSSTNTLTYGGGTNYTTNSVSGAKKYDVWGAFRSGNSTYPNTKYCANLGHIADEELGLIYMRARYYEPGSGRFISEDPAMDGRNWYVYCRNEPVGKIDKTGLSALIDLTDRIKDEVEFQAANFAVNNAAKVSMTASIMKSLERFSQKFGEALGDDFGYVFSSGNRVWITGIDNYRGGITIAIDFVNRRIHTYQAGSAIQGIIPHYFPDGPMW